MLFFPLGILNYIYICNMCLCGINSVGRCVGFINLFMSRFTTTISGGSSACFACNGIYIHCPHCTAVSCK